MKSWRELLGDKWDLSEEEEEEFGSRSHELYSVLEVIGEVEFFAHVGEEIESETVERVPDWQGALVILEDNGQRYSPNGHLWDPVRRIEGLMEGAKEHALWQRGINRLRGYFPDERTGRLPTSYDQLWRDQVDRHLWEYGICLVAEVLFQEELRMTYFREQLPWYTVGHFPCGWMGDWPLGKLRVF